MNPPTKLFLLLLLCSCNTKVRYYHGYIYSSDRQPLQHIKVQEDDDLKNYTYTDSTGYFKLIEVNDFSRQLILYDQQGHILDTIVTEYKMYEAGIRHQFINGRSDTLFLSPSPVSTKP